MGTFNVKKDETQHKPIFTAEPRTPELEEQLRSRVTVVGRVYWHNHLSQPVGVEDAYHYYLDSQDEPYSYQAKLGQNWTKLEYGWLEGKAISMVRVQNDEGRFSQSPDDLAKRVIEVGLDDQPVVQVPPAQASQQQWLCPERLSLRCVGSAAGAKCTITLYPK